MGVPGDPHCLRHQAQVDSATRWHAIRLLRLRLWRIGNDVCKRLGYVTNVMKRGGETPPTA